MGTSLCGAVRNVLEQGCLFLDRVSNDVCARPLGGVFAGTVGAHYRHVLDHFLSDTGSVTSNVAREVMFCVGHAIHHYAILKLLCAGAGVELPYEFGVAPSTLRHLEAGTSA
jgi:hypothetical protein